MTELPADKQQLRKYRWALFVFFFISGLRFASWASRIPDIQAHLHLSDAGLGSVLFALPIGSMAGLPVSGYCVTRFGSRKTLLIAALIFPVTMIGIGLSDTVATLFTLLFFFGLSSNLLNISMNTQAVAVEALYKRSIMASFHGTWSLGGFTGAAFSTWMMSMHVNPLHHFIIISSISLISMLLVYSNTIKQDVGKKSSGKIFSKPDRFLLLLGIIAFSSMVCEGTMADWSGVYFRKILHAPAGLVTLGYVAYMSMMTTGRFLGDRFVSRMGVSKVIKWSGLVIATGLLIAVTMPYIATAVIGFLFVGMGVSSVVPLSYAMAGRSKKMTPGVAIAAVSSVGFLGFLIGPPMIGFIAQAADLRWAFVLIAILGLGTTIVSGKLKEV
ncbi:MAG: MFS transporter [Bacteroidota bacterium]|nr:MFS transporter [Bacteroidota bacterium]